jgi:exosortase D (VPLPA-CTERM-specific)
MMSILTFQSKDWTPNHTLLLIGGAVLVAVAGFAGALWDLVMHWHRNEEYSHGFLIPFVAGWLLWTRRDALMASVGEPSWWGAAVLAVAALLHTVGELSAIFVLSQVGFILALIGIVLGVGGISLLRVTIIPIAFLLFAIPVPYFIEAMLSLRLQLISSQLGVFVISLFQIPVFLEGNVIDLGYFKLQVVEACSGLRYLYPLLSLGFLAGYLFQAPLWQRALVFLSSIPITIVMNGLRIGIVGVTVDRWGTEMAEGFLHLFEGWIIFVACAALLTGEIYLLARLAGKSFLDVFSVPKVEAAKVERTHGDAPRPLWPPEWSLAQAPLFACLFVLCATGLTVTFISHRSEIIPERMRFAGFPAQIGLWHGRTALLDTDTETGLGLDDYILSDYSKADGKQVNLYVAYYSSQRKGVSPHSPIVCIPGGGWQIGSFERTSVSLAGAPVPINRVVISRNSVREVVYYWFDERGKQIANEYWSKWYLLTDAITKNRTDGSLVRLSATILPGETERDADARLQAFMQVVVPSLGAYLPSATTEANSAGAGSSRVRS